MRTYVIREGSRYLLEQATLNRTLITSTVADRDITFEQFDLRKMEYESGIMTFTVGNRNYHVNKDSVTVLV